MSNEITLLRPSDTVLCPRGSGGDPIVIDLKAILKTQARIIEVQAVTPQKAPELLSAFNVTWRDLHQHITFLTKELNDAERSINRIRSTITLDEVPGILKERGLTNNEHHRNAVIELDPRYDEAVERRDQIAAVVEGLKGMLKATEMAYTSVKKLLGESAYNFLNRTDPHYGEEGKSGLAVGERSPDERPAQGSRTGFGSPRY